MSSELFTELSDQQQELVSGGLIHIDNVNMSSFRSKTQLLGGAGVSFAGPGGAAATGHMSGANQKINTSALSSQWGLVK